MYKEIRRQKKKERVRDLTRQLILAVSYIEEEERPCLYRHTKSSEQKIWTGLEIKKSPTTRIRASLYIIYR